MSCCLHDTCPTSDGGGTKSHLLRPTRPQSLALTDVLSERRRVLQHAHRLEHAREGGVGDDGESGRVAEVEQLCVGRLEPSVEIRHNQLASSMEANPNQGLPLPQSGAVL
eukprot:CAMPEP_0114313616 /NCGR_PEP_ID=MMETSP0059-20121206/21231_1 /TAXON_ID=36894 /ORGANISM="Pyramimonas parkeae, Strain CCMP726" /LENGTH=109 /DNA_ID=CAMNT_0001438425 /DNA_START=416 /DNA_END=745 /DNA_ORIENTATION=-